VQKVGAFLEKKTASDVWRARIGYVSTAQRAETDDIGKTNGSILMMIYRNVQVTLQILAALIEKAPRDLPLFAPYVLKILNIILRSRDITMVESSIPTFEAFCEHHDGASLAADQEYLHQYEEIVRIYASFASTRPPPTKPPTSAPVAMRWRSVGLQAIKSVASSEALASLAGRQLDVVVPILLENLWTDNEDFINLLEHRAQLEEKIDTEKLLRRRTSIATVRTVETATEANALALSGTTADADKVAEEDIGVLALQCLKQIFMVNNRSQIHGATIATLKFIADRVAQGESVIEPTPRAGTYRGWATRIFEITARWTPVQDRYVILVTAMDTLIRSTLGEENLQQQLVLVTMIDSLLKSDINLIGLSVMDVLLGLIQHVLRVLQLGGALPHAQQNDGSENATDVSGNPSPAASVGAIAEMATVPTDLRRELLARLQNCIGDLATHVYYADQISDMVSAILLRLKPSPLSSIPNTASAIENPNTTTSALASVGDLTEDPNTDGFFSFDTAKVKALEAIKSVLLVASHRKSMTGAGSLARNRVPVRVWEGTQWLLRDADGRVRKAYVDALLTWLDQEMTKSDLRIFDEKPKGLTKTTRDDSTTNLSKRAVSNVSHRDKPPKPSRTTFLQLLHLAVYENALQYVDSESDIVLLHLLLANLIENLGVNAVKSGLPMIFRLQEDILEVETPLAKIRVGSLCHGYFWTLSEKFDFDSSPTGRAIHNEIHRRRSKMFWVDRIRLPPIALDQIGTPGQATPQQALPIEEVESESLRPFDDRFQMVKLISLSYAETLAASQASPPTSPGRVFSHPILGSSDPAAEGDLTVPDNIKEQMMSEWSKESVIAVAQEGSKTVSLNGSRSGTNATGHRNFLAVNGNMNNGGTNSGTQSPQGRHPTHTHNSRPNSTYGLGGLGALQTLRKGSGQSPSPASESSRNSVTRVDQLKRVLSGQQNPLPGTRAGIAHSDASSESMVSYDFSASEVSFHHGMETGPPMERSASLREPERPRSKSRDRVAAAGEHSRPLSSHPVLIKTDQNVLPEPVKEEDLDAVPPVPPLPSSLVGEGTAAQDHAVPENIRKGRSVRRSEKGKGDRYQSSSWGEAAGGPVADLESLLNGIEAGGADTKGNVGRPPY
jgi:hypothetical protein